MAIIGKPLTVPESGWERIDNKNASISYVGTGWKSAPSSSYYNGESTYTYTSTDKVLFSFSGTGIRLISINDNYTAPNASIKIDGVLQTYTQFHSSGNQVLVFEKIGLPNTLHAVEIIATGATSSLNFNLDAIDIFHPTFDKTLILNEGAYKKYSSGAWQVVSSSTVTESHFFDGNSLIELSSIPETAWSQLTGDVELCYYSDDLTKTETQFNIETTPFTLAEEWENKTIKIIEYTNNPMQKESIVAINTEPFELYDELNDEVEVEVLYYTQDMNKNSVNLNVTANYSPLDEIDENFEVVTWTNNIDKDTKSISYTAIPKPKLIKQIKDIEIYGVINNINLNHNLNGNGLIKMIMSVDGGTTWNTIKFYGTRYAVKSVDINNLEEISGQGFSPSSLSLLNSSDWNKITPNKQIRFAYYIEQNSINDVAKIDQLLTNELCVIDSPKINSINVVYDAIDKLYYGLMFMDESRQYYSTSIGEILRYLDFGTLIAGQTSIEVEILLMNSYNFSVNNLKIDSVNDMNGVKIELSKTINPFISENSLFYSETLLSEQEIKFYIRLVVDKTAEVGGKFDIKVKADPIS